MHCSSTIDDDQTVSKHVTPVKSARCSKHSDVHASPGHLHGKRLAALRKFLDLFTTAVAQTR